METWEQATAQYNELLDCEGPVKVGGIEFDPSRILRELDPTAYRTGLTDYIDSEGCDSDDFEDDYQE